MLSIGEFSKITGLSIKTLRFYHEKGVLHPSWVDEKTGYRYYNEDSAEKARVVSRFRDMEFSLEEIRRILQDHDDEADILDFLQRQKEALEGKMRDYRDIVLSLDRILTNEREAKAAMQNSTFEVEEKALDPVLLAGVRIKGKYSECGSGFARIGKSFGRHICGKPFCLHYDEGYREEADFEACMPIRRRKEVAGISVRELSGGRCVALLHQGPYEQLGRSYAKILQYVKEKGYEILRPTREVYLKGPGMILRGNPKKYLTEIQMLIEQ